MANVEEVWSTRDNSAVDTKLESVEDVPFGEIHYHTKDRPFEPLV